MLSLKSTPQPPQAYFDLGGLKSTPPRCFYIWNWEGRNDELGGFNPPNPPGNSHPGLQYGTLYLLTYVTRHLFTHSPLNSKPTFSHLNSFTHSYRSHGKC